MLKRREVKRLIEQPLQEGSCTLSLYLDVDQSKEVNLNRGFEASFRNLLRSLGRNDHQPCSGQLQKELEILTDSVANYDPGARTLVIFSNSLSGLFWQQELPVAVPSRLIWARRPYIRPLLEALDEFERYGVVLVDRAQARLFTFLLGEVEEHQEAFAPAEVKHIKSPGTDHLRSQMQLQRKSEVHTLWHLKQVAERMEQMAERYDFARLILAGSPEVTGELKRLLPEAIRQKVVGTVSLSMDAGLGAVRELTLELHRAFERRQESDLVQRLVTEAAKGGGAVTGLEATLETLQEGRIWTLVYADGFQAEGEECVRCGGLFRDGTARCRYCDAPLQGVPDLVECAVEKVFQMGGLAEQVRGEAARRLQEAGHIGALLRY